MCVLERAGNLRGNLHCILQRNHLLAIEPLAETLALDVRHDVVQKSVSVAGLKQREDVRMLQLGGDLDP